jgi:hypothetical protein
MLVIVSMSCLVLYIILLSCDYYAQLVGAMYLVLLEFNGGVLVFKIELLCLFHVDDVYLLLDIYYMEKNDPSWVLISHVLKR